jgi:hypothetical protein
MFIVCVLHWLSCQSWFAVKVCAEYIEKCCGTLLSSKICTRCCTCVCSTSRGVTRLALPAACAFILVWHFHFAWLCCCGVLRRSAPMHVTPKICNRAESVAKRVAYHNKSRRTLNKIESSPILGALCNYFFSGAARTADAQRTHHRVVCDEILSLLLQVPWRLAISTGPAGRKEGFSLLTNNCMRFE